LENKYKLYNGDCLEVMRNIPDKSIDMVLCDPPYGFTDAEWDNIIDVDEMFKQLRRVTKNKRNIVLFSNQPFTTTLISSYKSGFRYNWYWVKNNVTGALIAKVQPMRKIEEILVFSVDGNEGMFEKTRQYLNDERKKSGKTLSELKTLLGTSMTSHYFTNGKQFTLPSRSAYEKLQKTGCFQMPYDELRAIYDNEKQTHGAIYNPQGLKELDAPIVKKRVKGSLYRSPSQSTSTQTVTGYPTNVLEFNNVPQNQRLHPTQKPVELLEYLIKTYTHEDMTVLDFTMGSGSTGVACVNTNRRFIGIELDKNYYNTAKQRIEKQVTILNGSKQ
jgi:DNA modification methylase